MSSDYSIQQTKLLGLLFIFQARLIMVSREIHITLWLGSSENGNATTASSVIVVAAIVCLFVCEGLQMQTHTQKGNHKTVTSLFGTSGRGVSMYTMITSASN